MPETFEQAIAELRRLRCDLDAAEARFYRAARVFEVKHKPLWMQHYASFEALFEEEHLGDIGRYRNFLAAEKIVGSDNIDVMGVSAAIQAARISDVERRTTYIEAATVRAKTDGVPWSDRTARKNRERIVGQPPQNMSWNGKEDREKQLREENVALKKENLRLKKEIKARDEEIARLRKRLTREVPRKRAS